MSEISAKDPYPRKRVEVEGTSIAYIDSGEGRPVLFLHDNPTASWSGSVPQAYCVD